MSDLEFKGSVKVTATIELDEQMLGALDALVGYGTDPFIKAFYEVMGKSYLRPYESGLRALFAHVSANVPWMLRRAKQARQALQKTNPPRAMMLGDLGLDYDFGGNRG